MDKFTSVLLVNKTKLILMIVLALFFLFFLIVLDINVFGNKSLIDQADAADTENFSITNISGKSQFAIPSDDTQNTGIPAVTVGVEDATVSPPVSSKTPTVFATSAKRSGTVVPGFTATRTPSRVNTVVGPTVTPIRTSTSAPIFTSTRTPTRTNTAMGPTVTPIKTFTSSPTFTPVHTPTRTLSPTRTPTATFTRTHTPTKTFTPTPTRTPTPTFTPTATVDGEFRGTGNQKIDISKWQEPAILSVTYPGSGSFEIISYDLKGLPLSTVVEVSGLYDGNFALNFGNIHFSSIQVLTSGNWEIKILPLNSASVLPVPGSLTGKNATVFLVNELFFELSLDAPSASDWVSVIGYGDDGYTKILVSQLAPYTGTIKLAEPEIKVLEINVTGPWFLEIK